MSISMSRFAVLKMDEEADPSNRTQAKPKAVANGKGKTQVTSKGQKKGTATGQGQGQGKSKQKSNKSQAQGKNASQFDEWQEVDDKLSDQQYVNDLKTALLLSKTQNEGKPTRASSSPDAEEGEKEGKGKKGKKKPPTVSLEEFRDQIPNDSKHGVRKVLPPTAEASGGVLGSDEDEMMRAIQLEAEKLLRIDSQTSEQKKKKKTPTKETNVRLLEIQEKLHKKDVEVLSLQEEAKKLREELLQVKMRNKKLCSILSMGEMMEKTEILIQLDKLTQIKDELTQQVTSLHVSLEQEKSKVHSLQDELKKVNTSNYKKRSEDLSNK
jgi:hypothetical protein